MKILHVTKKYLDALGGDTVVVANLQKHQRAAGHEVIILTSNCSEIISSHGIYKVGLKDNASALDAITPRRTMSLVILFFTAFVILYKERPDVIHTHSIDMAFMVSWAARWRHVPIIHTFHIVTFYDPSQSVIRRKTELWLARKAKLRRATAPNAYDVAKLQAAGLKQTTLLPNGVDVAFWTNVKRTAAPRKNFLFTSTGRIEPQKGHMYLLQATAQLAKMTHKPFAVNIVGGGSQAMALHAHARSLGIDRFVTFSGRQTPQAIKQLLARTDAAVLPALYETTPLTLLEAWAASVPVIATPTGILRDQPPSTASAEIVPIKNEQALAQAMKRLMNNAALRKQLAANGTKEVQQYDWQHIAQIADAIYRSST